MHILFPDQREHFLRVVKDDGYAVAVLVPQEWEVAHALQDSHLYDELLREKWEPYSERQTGSGVEVAFKRPKPV